ncbi:MAG: chromate resistance protein [Clostridia bacterium]|nr:chromate resistance protein [Clostridia bacterium]
MKWITWENIGIDRMACAWLIKNHIDKDCEFLFIPAGADYSALQGIPFDIPGVKLSHKRGHCSFHTFLKEYKLSDPLLYEIAKIIDGADTISDLAIPEESMGLDAICIGLRKICETDKETLEKSRLIFDSLYAYLANKQ